MAVQRTRSRLKKLDVLLEVLVFRFHFDPDQVAGWSLRRLLMWYDLAEDWVRRTKPPPEGM